jgi:hypothetical protein
MVEKRRFQGNNDLRFSRIARITQISKLACRKGHDLEPADRALAPAGLLCLLSSRNGAGLSVLSGSKPSRLRGDFSDSQQTSLSQTADEVIE